MIFSSFEKVMSRQRMLRYLNSCRGDKRKAQTLYRLNLRLSQEMFTIICCFEVALRNAIDSVMSNTQGKDWLRDSILPGGTFDNPLFSGTAKIIGKAYKDLVNNGNYSCSKMLSAMEFGIWKYMFSSHQYLATGRKLLSIFPNKPKSSAIKQYNNLFVFNELDAVNRLRNRIAHHEPICFMKNKDIISTSYLHNCYNRIINLFFWMGIDADKLLYGLDHVQTLSVRIESLKGSIE